MQMQEVRFVANGSAVNLILGFQPDMIMAVEGLEETNPDVHLWWKSLAAAGANGQYGLILTGSTGVVTKHAAAANGFAAYSTADVGLEIVSPDGDGYQIADGSNVDYDATATYTARSATALGSVVRPTPTGSNGRTGLVYECTTASGGASGTEPTWPTAAGDSVTAGSGDVWIAREERIKATGGEGITFGATGQTDSDEWLVVAYQFDKVVNKGDSALADPL